MAETIASINSKINGIVWGVPAMILILGAGLLLSVLCKFPQFTQIGRASCRERVYVLV